MYTRVSTFILPLLLSALCVAASVLTRTGGPNHGPGNHCSTGSIQCCNSIQSAHSAPVAVAAGLLGIPINSLTGQVGLTCTPVNVIGVGGNSCTHQAACCTGNNFHGALVVGCSPINLNV